MPKGKLVGKNCGISEYFLTAFPLFCLVADTQKVCMLYYTAHAEALEQAPEDAINSVAENSTEGLRSSTVILTQAELKPSAF